ncbi:MAG: 23S rRNA (adenine(2503)-C(2))-methyltransferase RlmN [Desulfobacteraceae bacterium]|nr:23S rRNA (adenine(2503)-C(2))-methyltransferase RlmN [Desulfobacteraceae bacterium]
MGKTDQKGLGAHEIEQWAMGQGLDAYRGRQIRHWLFKKMAESFEEMTTLPKELRASLQEKACIGHLKKVETQESRDGTKKYLFKLEDDHFIESVLIPERDHYTLCISSQAGCAMDCRFCLTAKQGLKRNLTASEIVDQVIHLKRSMSNPDRLTNIVFMGMGEPLANYEAVKKAVINLMDDTGLNFSRRKITLSTCGLVPQMERWGREVKIKLAVSLNAADDNTRSLLMPINKKYALEALLKACKTFPLPRGERITFEYILIKEINDGDDDAKNLAEILTGIQAKINLIPLNPHEGTPMSPPSIERINQFQEILLKRNYTAIIRKSRGSDICAACGQLSGEASRIR